MRFKLTNILQHYPCLQGTVCKRFTSCFCLLNFSFTPVWGALQCHFSQPWDFSCSDPPGQPGCRTSHRRPRHIYHPAGNKYQQFSYSNSWCEEVLECKLNHDLLKNARLKQYVEYFKWWTQGVMQGGVIPFIHQLKFLYTVFHVAWTELPHLVAYHNVGDLGLAVHVLVFLLIGKNWEDEVTRFTLALPYQEATGSAFVCEQFLCISPREVPVIPPGDEWENRLWYTNKWIQTPYSVTNYQLEWLNMQTSNMKINN